MAALRSAGLNFLKVHGAGNDFVLVADPADASALDAALVRALCDRHFGVGGDGVLRIAPPRTGSGADVFMDYRNADGSIAEMCGNGVRCVAKFIADRWTSEPDLSGFGPPSGDPDVVRVDTRAGVKPVAVHRGADGLVTGCTVGMGAPVVGETELVFELGDGARWRVTTVSMGNPHAVIVVDDVATAPVATVGPALAGHSAFPEGTNVEFVQVHDRDRVRGRIWERGVGETLASGTGGSAIAVAAHVLGRADRRVAVELPGGTLQIDWQPDELFVTGPAVEVATGTVPPAWFAAMGQS